MVEVMKAVRLLALALLWSGAAAPLTRGQGPVTTGSETVAKKKNPSSATPDADKNSGGTIPSEFKVNKNNPQPAATFHTDALTVAVDVAVLDSNGHFIPKIPQGNFRILEDNQPQKITGFSMGEAPMTITMVIEFSNRFESFYSAAWFQVLNAAYGFLQTLKPEDYVAVSPTICGRRFFPTSPPTARTPTRRCSGSAWPVFPRQICTMPSPTP